MNRRRPPKGGGSLNGSLKSRMLVPHAGRLSGSVRGWGATGAKASGVPFLLDVRQVKAWHYLQGESPCRIRHQPAIRIECCGHKEFWKQDERSSRSVHREIDRSRTREEIALSEAVVSLVREKEQGTTSC